MMDSNTLDILSFKTKSVFETKYPISDSYLEEVSGNLNVTTELRISPTKSTKMKYGGTSSEETL